MKRTLSIFCDESGDFGQYSEFSKYYIVGFVFHDQSNDIHNDIRILKSKMEKLGHPTDEQIHSFPIIRGEGDYRNRAWVNRMQILCAIAAFYRVCKIKSSSIFVEKSESDTPYSTEAKVFANIDNLIVKNSKYLSSFDEIILYYDSGQKSLKRILKTCFRKHYPDTIIRKITPNEKILFQTADLVCTIKLLQTKYPNLTNREYWIFRDRKLLKKGFFKLLKLKELS